MLYGPKSWSQARHIGHSSRLAEKGVLIMNHRKVFRGLVLTFLVSACAFAVQSLRASPPIGAVVQTWHYDPLTNIVTLKIVNTSHKDITAFNIAIKETTQMGMLNNTSCWRTCRQDTCRERTPRDGGRRVVPQAVRGRRISSGRSSG